MIQNTPYTLRLDRIVGGGQTIGTLENGKKAFVWGGLPRELVEIHVTKSKSKLVEGIVTRVLEPSNERVEPKEQNSYLSTSPWQILSYEAELSHKANLINEAFELHGVTLPEETVIWSDGVEYGYRNKVEFSWYGSSEPTADSEQPTEHGNPQSNIENLKSTPELLDLAFFKRGSKGKITVDGMLLARPEINELARQIRDLIQKKGVTARSLKTLLIRCDQKGNCVWQLYVKGKFKDIITKSEAEKFSAQGGEVIYSDPRSPASKITERLTKFGNIVLEDTILGVPFRYATEGFFQVNVPVYEQALKDMGDQLGKARDESQESRVKNAAIGSEMPHKRVVRGGADPKYVSSDETILGADRATGPAHSDLRSEAYDGSGQNRPTIDLYSGVGTIGLTIGGDNAILVEVNEDAVREMRENIAKLGKNAEAVLAPSEKALEYITKDSVIIVDPPRAGLHSNVIDRLLDVHPPQIIYLSCNPVTQARDVSLLLQKYRIVYHRGYNFFPRTPHIEHLVVLERIA